MTSASWLVQDHDTNTPLPSPMERYWFVDFLDGISSWTCVHGLPFFLDHTILYYRYYTHSFIHAAGQSHYICFVYLPTYLHGETISTWSQSDGARGVDSMIQAGIRSEGMIWAE